MVASQKSCHGSYGLAPYYKVKSPEVLICFKVLENSILATLKIKPLFHNPRLTVFTLHVFFYKHTKIQNQAQRCLGRELNEAEKMLEGCLDPKLNFGEIPKNCKIPVKNSQK